ncbi:HAD hydrolase family protein [bacterium]|nr:HAD hydrolase family protein [bacterium]
MSNLKLPNTIKMVITDFDGVITDNCVYISDDGVMSRKINFKDVVGFYMLKRNGIDIAIISGEKNAAIETIAKNLEIKEVYQSIRDKLPILKDILSRKKLSQDEYLYIGDEINDIECLNYSKYRITVPNATDKVKAITNIQMTQVCGGNGAFREVADCLTN